MKLWQIFNNRWGIVFIYVSCVVLLNVGFSLSPQLDWFWSLVAGTVLVLRDLCQRYWSHRTLLWMVVAALFSYVLGMPRLALASATAFLVSETVDWAVYSTTHRPFADRVFLSVCASAPVDTACFLLLAQIWSLPLFWIGVGAKVSMGFLLSLLWRHRAHPG